MTKIRPTASLIIIGNEILSGRTQDTNLNYLARDLAATGIDFLEARIIPDMEREIIKAVNDLRKKYDYVFTTGGVGPTHDDITSESIAKAFGVPLVRDPEIVRRLNKYYEGKKAKLNSARLRRANIAEGARLIDNPLTSAPGFYIENVFVMAGFPSIMQVMFEGAKKLLKVGKPQQSRTITIDISEGEVAEELFELQEKYKEIDIGSYPFSRGDKYCTSLVMRGDNEIELTKLEHELVELCKQKGAAISAETRKN